MAPDTCPSLPRSFRAAQRASGASRPTNEPWLRGARFHDGRRSRRGPGRRGGKPEGAPRADPPSSSSAMPRLRPSASATPFAARVCGHRRADLHALGARRRTAPERRAPRCRRRERTRRAPRLRKLRIGAIDFVYFGTGIGIVKNAEDALSNDGSAFFVRPSTSAASCARSRRSPAVPCAPRGTAFHATAFTGDRSGGCRELRTRTWAATRRPPSSERSSTPSLPLPGAHPGPPLPMTHVPRRPRRRTAFALARDLRHGEP